MRFCGCATTTVLGEPKVAFDSCDDNTIVRVEREARRRGSAVRWYRCPQWLPVHELPPFHFGEQRGA
jgi:hypothetical protein